MSTTTGEPAPRRASRGMRVLLFVSLAFNLLIVGTVAAGIWRIRHAPPVPLSGDGPVSMFGFAASLPPDRRDAIWRETEAMRHALRPLRADVRAARQEVQSSLLAEPFDAAQFAKAQSRLLEAEIRARTESQKLMLAIASRLTPDERKAFARVELGKGPPKGRGGWWRGREAEEGPRFREGPGELEPESRKR